MLYVALLATDPESQGHGYGGALLETVNDIVRRFVIYHANITEYSLMFAGGCGWQSVVASL